MPMTPEEYVANQKRLQANLIRIEREHEANIPTVQRKGYWMEKSVNKAYAQGNIISEKTRNWMEGEINAARLMLGIGMAATALFKGQWIIWIVMSVIYVQKVKDIKNKARNKDMKDYNYIYKKGE